MDTVESVVTAKRTLHRLDKPSIGCWLVAHNGKDVAHVIEMNDKLSTLTGLDNLEKFAAQADAEKRATAFGWKPQEIEDIINGRSIG